MTISVGSINLDSHTAAEISAAFLDYLNNTVKPEEGGYSNDPNDPGGETNWGITIADARTFGYTGAMASMTWDEAILIYTQKYWVEPGFDKLAAVNLPLALELLDLGINMGDITVCKWPQSFLSIMGYYAGTIDGQFGPMSQAATKSFLTSRGQDGLRVMYMAIRAGAYDRYTALAEANSTLKEYLWGWLAQRAFPAVSK